MGGDGAWGPGLDIELKPEEAIEGSLLGWAEVELLLMEGSMR